MQRVYNAIWYIVKPVLVVLSWFSAEKRAFVKGRKLPVQTWKNTLAGAPVFWMHCSSLGEYEQGRPVLEDFREKHPACKTVLTFFSPSGYEVTKDKPVADVIGYLPYDTQREVKNFLDTVQPAVAVFVKYEFWPNLLYELHRRKIPVLLISARFRAKHFLLHKRTPVWFRRVLQTFRHFFVQDENSAALLRAAGFHHVSVSGDTRFDRVANLPLHRKQFPEIEKLIKGKNVLVAGSTWEKDENLLTAYRRQCVCNHVFVIYVPHKISPDHIQSLKRRAQGPVILYSELKENTDITHGYNTLIIDEIGILSSVYAYADVAYIGGGFGRGIHNILEAATYGKPVIFGPVHQKFIEATELIRTGGAFTVSDLKSLTESLDSLLTDPDRRNTAGQKAGEYVQSHTGATQIITEYIDTIIQKHVP